MSVCFGRDILQHQERRNNADNPGTARGPVSNVFFSHRTDSLRLELALLAMPVLAIAVALALLPQSDTSANRPKVTLRVTSVAPPPNPELEREAQLRREQIRFALSKVASAPETEAGSETIAAASAGSTEGAVPIEASVSQTVSQAPLAAPRDIRPQKLKRSVARAASKRKAQRIRLARAQAQRKAIRPRAQAIRSTARQATAGEWLAASLKWPAAAASATMAPVQRTLSRTVSEASEAFDSLKKKIL
jgi:hypothetical protein